jgi:hypothetical protein
MEVIYKNKPTPKVTKKNQVTTHNTAIVKHPLETLACIFCLAFMAQYAQLQRPVSPLPLISKRLFSTTHSS